ncbi:MAG: hypothetical protein AWU57_64 [Marinobacter sp. T13-3]|nr:MAG: hypothetical protein AWU57_64 [Marinobacter sp. T13-3]
MGYFFVLLLIIFSTLSISLLSLSPDALSPVMVAGFAVLGFVAGAFGITCLIEFVAMHSQRYEDPAQRDRSVGVVRDAKSPTDRLFLCVLVGLCVLAVVAAF